MTPNNRKWYQGWLKQLWAERAMTDHVRDEVRAIDHELREVVAVDTEMWRDLYVAQQALCWALQPEKYLSPLRLAHLGPQAGEHLSAPTLKS